MIRTIAAFGAMLLMTAGAPVAAQESKMSWTDWLLEGAKSCNKSRGLTDTSFGVLIGDGRTLEQADALFHKILQDKIKEQQACLTAMKPSAPAEYKAGFDQAVAATYADLHAVAKDSRPRFIANPAGYTMIGRYAMSRYASYAPEKLTAALAAYARLKPLEQACGTYAFVTPAEERGAIDRAWNAAQPYLQCVEAYQKNAPPEPGYFQGTIRVAEQNLRGFAPFVCSKWRQAGCVDDAAWQALAAVATPTNVALANKGGEIWEGSKRHTELIAMQYDRWVDDLQSKSDRLDARK